MMDHDDHDDDDDYYYYYYYYYYHHHYDDDEEDDSQLLTPQNILEGVLEIIHVILTEICFLEKHISS